MEVRSVTNPGQAGTNAGSTVVPNQANNPVPAAVASNNHVSKAKTQEKQQQQQKRRKRPGKVKTTLPLVKSKESDKNDEV